MPSYHGRKFKITPEERQHNLDRMKVQFYSEFFTYHIYLQIKYYVQDTGKFDSILGYFSSK